MPLVKMIGAWIWVAAVALLSVGAFSDGSIIAGLILLLAAILPLPVRAFLDEFAKHSIPRGRVWLVAVVLMIVGMSVVVANTPTDRGQSAASKAQAASTVELVEKPTPPNTAQLRQEMKAIYGEVIRIGNRCDKAFEAAGAELRKIGEGTTSFMAAYGQADEAETVCSESRDRFAEIAKPTGLTKEQQQGLNKALDICAGAYGIKMRALGTLKAVLDGDGRPSLKNSFVKDVEAAQGGTLLCVGDIMNSANGVGVPLEDLTDEAEKIK